jgi:hypothetical protein
MNGNVVAWTDSWMDRYQIDVWNNPNLRHVDASALIGTPNHPEQGSIWDPNSNTYDVTVPLEAWDKTQICDIAGVSTQSTRKDCKKGSIVSLIDNKVVFVFDGPDTAWASQFLSLLKSTKFVEYTALAEQKLQPAMGATYNSTTKTFSKTDPLFLTYNEFSSVTETNKFDLIFVDGVDNLRRDFAIKTWSALKDDGVMIFHDTRRAQDFQNAAWVAQLFFNELEWIDVNARASDFNSSNMTVLCKKPYEPYVNWNNAEDKPLWAYSIPGTDNPELWSQE